jgi:hypothetical protein
MNALRLKHPGILLREEFLEPLGLTVAGVARATGISQPTLSQVVNAAMCSKPRFETMKAFFAGVGEGDTAGTWQDTPQLHPDFREKFARRAAKAKAAAEEIP